MSCKKQISGRTDKKAG